MSAPWLPNKCKICGFHHATDLFACDGTPIRRLPDKDMRELHEVLLGVPKQPDTNSSQDDEFIRKMMDSFKKFGL
jgi:hypothetical protein